MVLIPTEIFNNIKATTTTSKDATFIYKNGFWVWAEYYRYTDLPSLAASNCYNSQRAVVYLPLLIPQLEPIRAKNVRSFAPSFGKSGYLINSAYFKKKIGKLIMCGIYMT